MLREQRPAWCGITGVVTGDKKRGTEHLFLRHAHKKSAPREVIQRGAERLMSLIEQV